MSQQHPITEPTGVYNKFVFNVLLQHEISRTRRYPMPISLLQIVLLPEYLQPENLERARQVIAYILNRFLRSADVPAQDKNDFFVLLPQTDLAGARCVGSRILSRLEDSQIGAGGLPFKVTACIGLTWHMGGDSLTAEKLLQNAQLAAQLALQNGPNSLVIYPEPSS